MSETALIVRVPEAEPLVADLRARLDPSAAEGLPAHVTVLVPFVPLADLDAAARARLEAALGAHAAFDFELVRVGRFERTAWLAPEPATPFVALTRAVMRAFPGMQPYGGRHTAIVPHLTAADGDAEAAAEAAATLATRLTAQGPVRARCREVELLENADGRWHRVDRLALADTARGSA